MTSPCSLSTDHLRLKGAESSWYTIEKSKKGVYLRFEKSKKGVYLHFEKSKKGVSLIVKYNVIQINISL